MFTFLHCVDCLMVNAVHFGISFKTNNLAHKLWLLNVA